MRWVLGLGCVVALIVGLLFGVSSSTPLVVANSSKQLADADSLPALMNELKRAYRYRRLQQSVTVSQAQLNALLGSAQRAMPALQGQSQVGRYSAVVELSYRLPLARFLNLKAELRSGSNIPLESLEVGSWPLPISWFWGAVNVIGDWYLGSGLTQEAIASVRQIELKEGLLQINLGPTDGLVSKLRYLSEHSQSDEVTPLQNLVRVYLQQLAVLPTPPSGHDVLAYRLAKLFELAPVLNQGESIRDHNAAIVFAMAIYDGGYPLRHLVGNIHKDNVVKTREFEPNIILGRRDLYLHFIYSASLHLFSQRGLSFAAGEVKEMMDRSADGSGFSFVDLAADMAGIAFARQLSSDIGAQTAQQVLAEVKADSVYFPKVDGLVENLNKQAFEAQFQGLDSPAYKRVVDDIQHRIADLSLYNYDLASDRRDKSDLGG